MQRNASGQNAKRGVWATYGSQRFTDGLEDKGFRPAQIPKTRHPALPQPASPHAGCKLSAAQAERRQAAADGRWR